MGAYNIRCGDRSVLIKDSVLEGWIEYVKEAHSTTNPDDALLFMESAQRLARILATHMKELISD